MHQRHAAKMSLSTALALFTLAFWFRILGMFVGWPSGQARCSKPKLRREEQNRLL